jgi:hypothetical protein
VDGRAGPGDEKRGLPPRRLRLQHPRGRISPVPGRAGQSPDSFAFRWAATAREDGRMKLQLQSLPASAVFITGKPLLKG